MLRWLPMAYRPGREPDEVLSEKDLKELRYKLAHLSAVSVRDFYEQATANAVWSTLAFRIPRRFKPWCRCGNSFGNGADSEH